jgi:hypothetical protein
MSYDIIYKRQFIKVDDKRVIPMIQYGSNNTYEGRWGNKGRAKRARDWERYEYKLPNPMVTLEEMLTAQQTSRLTMMEQYINYTDERWSRFSSIQMYGKGYITFQQWANFFKNGFKDALTVEELAEYRIYLKMYLSTYSLEDTVKRGYDAKAPVIFGTTEELIEKVTEWEDYYGELKGRIRFILLCDDWNFEALRRNKAPKRTKHEKTRTEVDEYYVLKCLEVQGYLVKYTRSGYRYSYYPDSYSTKKFRTEKEAEKYRGNLRSPNKFEVAKITQKQIVWV